MTHFITNVDRDEKPEFVGYLLLQHGIGTKSSHHYITRSYKLKITKAYFP